MTLSSVNLPGWCNPEAVYVARDELLEAYSQPTWAKDGLCREHPEISFFPERGESTVAAKVLCSQCLVRAECLASALERGERHGIWGGTSERERRHLRKIVSSGNA